MTDHDHVRELADRAAEKQRRGEELGLEFELDFASLTDDQRDEFMALLEQRGAHHQERLEAVAAEYAAAKALLRLQVRMAPGMSLTEAIDTGRIGLLEVIRAIRAVPDPLAGQSPD